MPTTTFNDISDPRIFIILSHTSLLCTSIGYVDFPPRLHFIPVDIDPRKFQHHTSVGRRRRKRRESEENTRNKNKSFIILLLLAEFVTLNKDEILCSSSYSVLGGGNRLYVSYNGTCTFAMSVACLLFCHQVKKFQENQDSAVDWLLKCWDLFSAEPSGPRLYAFSLSHQVVTLRVVATFSSFCSA